MANLVPPEQRNEPHLVAAGDKNAGHAIEQLFRVGVKNILPRGRPQNPRVCYPEISKGLRVNIRRKLGKIRGHGNDQHLGFFLAGQRQEFFQDPPLVILVLGPADHKQMASDYLTVNAFYHLIFISSRKL